MGSPANFLANPWTQFAGGVAGAIGGLFPQTSTTNTNFNQNQSGTSSQEFQNQGSTTPVLDPYADTMRKTIDQSAMQNLNTDTDLSGYEAGGLKQINDSAGVQDQILKANLAARGLSYSPVAATAENQGQIARVSQGSQFVNQIPLLRQQMYQQKLQQALQVFQANPYGTATQGSGSASGQQQSNTTGSSTSKTTSGGGVGGFLNGLAGFLG